MKKYVKDKLPLSLQELLKIVTLNLKYSFNRITTLFILFSFVVLIVLLIINSKVFVSSSEKIIQNSNIIKEYVKNGFFFTNLVTSLLIIGVPSIVNKSFENNLFIIKNRKDIFISKVIQGFLIVLVISFISFSLFVFIPSVFIKGFIIDNKIIMYFIRLILQLSMLYFVMLILQETTNNSFSIILISILYIVCLISNQNYIEISSFMKLMQNVFPIILLSGNNSQYLNGEGYVLIYVIFAIIIFGVIFVKKDINV